MNNPPFVHDFDRWWTHNWEYAEAHTKPGAVHLELDFVFIKIQRRLTRHKKKPWYPPFRAILSFLWGINCGFPFRDIIQFVIWEYRGFPRSLLNSPLEGENANTK